MNEELTYVTGNYGKYISVKEYFERKNININYYKCDLEELDINDIELISRKKALDAFNILKSPCFVADSGFYIEDYPNNPDYPGAFVKRSNVSKDVDSLLEVMKDKTNRKCKFVDCLTFYDGEDFYTFYGISEGTLSKEKRGSQIKKAKSNLWYVFIPNNHEKTLAEMTDEERINRQDKHTSATQQFLEWYVNIYKKNNVLKKEI